jgi:hypothetical protein
MSSTFDPHAAYSSGFVGCRKDPRADEVFADYVLRYGGDPNGANVAYDWGLEQAGAGRLSTLWVTLEKVFPGCLPGPSQLYGDCVSHGAAHCLGASIAAEIWSNKPDEVTGRLEGVPEMPEEGIKNFPIAPESLFAWRGYNGDGWVCSEAAKTACEKGFLIRKPYPELKIDLTEYNEKTIKLGGATPPGESWLRESKQHVARTATFVKGREQVRDFLAAGFGVFNCSNLGFEKTRNEDGVSRQVGSWGHSQCFLGYDDRPETHKKYGQALTLWANSWGRWDSGSRKVMGTDLLIPEGCYWALADTIDRCQCIALSSVAGWPRRKHTTWGAEGNV